MFKEVANSLRYDMISIEPSSELQICGDIAAKSVK